MWRTLAFLVLAAGILFAGCRAIATGNKAQQETVITSNQNTTTTMTIEDIKTGTGATADAGKLVTVHYVGTLTNGAKFDSSRDRGTPFTFNLGAGQVIEGWDKGVAGMKVGGVRKLIIPPDMAYGNRAIGSIPANSTLVFEVELLGVK